MLLHQRFVRFSLMMLLSMPYFMRVICCGERCHTVATENGPITKIWDKDGESYVAYTPAVDRTLHVSQSSSGSIFAGSFDSDGGCIFVSKDNFFWLKKDYEAAVAKEQLKLLSKENK